MIDEGSSFGALLKQRRRYLDLTQEALAQQVGCALSTIKKIEQGILRPSRQIAERLAECLEITAEERDGFIRTARLGMANGRVPDQRQALPMATTALDALACPYPGMTPFGSEDAHRFFGREAEVPLMVEALRLYPLLTVIGPSGSGKSSLVFAGLVPALRKSTLFGMGSWSIRSVRPGEQPLARLAQVLGGELEDPLSALREREPAQASRERIVLIVDQLEEIFTIAAEQSEPFQRALQELIRLPGCLLILTVRADFYPELMGSALWRQIQAHRFELTSLHEQGLREAIIFPAESVGVQVESALVERLIADATNEPGVLPLVQETLVLLWERREGPEMALHAYESIVLPAGAAQGDLKPRTGLHTALARWADAVLAGMSETQRQLARRIFLRLVHFGEGRADTRRQQAEDELRALGDDHELFDETLTHLAQRRLLTLSGSASDEYARVDLAHESLITAWPALQQWLSERKEAEQMRRRLEDKAAEWQRLGRGKGGLLDEAELQEAQRWLESPDASDLGSSETLVELVRTSELAIDEAARAQDAARQRELSHERERALLEYQRAEEQTLAARRLRLRLVIAVSCAILAVLAALSAGYSFQQARQQARLATSRFLESQALSIPNDQLDLALLLAVESYKMNPDTSGQGTLLRLLEDTPEIISFVSHGGAELSDLRQIAWSPRGERLALISAAGLTLWDAQSLRPLAEPAMDPALAGDGLRALAWSPDGSRLAVARDDDSLLIWTPGGEEPPALLTHVLTGLATLAWSPGGNLLAAGGEGGTLLWDVSAGRALGAPLGGHSAAVQSLAWSPDGSQLASADGKTLLLWDSASQRLRRALDLPVEQIAWHGDLLALSTGAEEVLLWQHSRWAQFGARLSSPGGRILQLAWSGDGSWLASSGVDGTITLWDVRLQPPAGRRLRGAAQPLPALAWRPGSSQLLSGTRDGSVILWEATARQGIGTLLAQQEQRTSVLAWSNDGRQLASGSNSGQIAVWDVERRERTMELELGSSIESLAWSPDGSTLAAGGRNNALKFWDIATSTPFENFKLTVLQPFERSITHLDWSGDGRYMAIGTNEVVVSVWDSVTEQLIVAQSRATGVAPFAGRDALVSLVWSPNSELLASLFSDGRVEIWDRLALRSISMRQFQASSHGQLIWSSAGDRLIVAGTAGVIWVWDFANDRIEQEHSLARQSNLIALPPNGNVERAILQDLDFKLGIWNVPLGQRVGQAITAHAARWNVAAWSPGGELAATAAADGRILLWQLDPAAWVAQACRIANRNLTPQEWAQYVGDLEYHQTCL